MASYHIQINVGPKGKALEHAQYIQREGPFTEERYGEVAARGVANMPEWAREDTASFWRASDEFERANGNTYREYELALPRELSPEARVALVERFASQELGSTRPYQWAIHTCTASDGKEQPHVHLMFSDRQHDGIERGPEQFFKRYNGKNPERGGARKFSYGADKAEAAMAYEGIRERWATVQNQALEAAGVEARVDHRSLAAQGIRHREPQLHRGPAVSGIEARGHVSEVGERQREQRQVRAQARTAVVAEVRVVTRAEVAAERVAVRERRELAQEVTGAERAMVLPLVEADRQEQLGRAQAAVERRIERRQGLSMGEFREKLVAQARALRERIGREFGRVKDWVRERFPEPFRQLKSQARDLFGRGAEKGSAAPPGAKKSAEDVQAESRQRWLAERELAKGMGAPMTLEEVRRQGREDWLKLRAEMAQENSPAAPTTPQKSLERGPKIERPVSDGKPQELTLEQLKAQGRADIEGMKQELRAEQLHAAKELEQAQARARGGRGRSLGRTPGDDDPPQRVPGDDGPKRGRGRGGPGMGM